ncbi:hypothetical protein B0O99DRAFT_735993 [Bisporella sp. PMI_857]|nr:hypothetical protein B0O99DRAFT_735993 [Bisporella sp. PMI_857]
MNLMPLQHSRKYTRKPHSKARTGCQNCKRRKIKCDESKPSCANCTRRSLHCSFDTASGLSQCFANPELRIIEYKASKIRRCEDKEAVETFPSFRDIPLLTDDTNSMPTLSYKDLQLFYHFSTSSVISPGYYVGGDTYWREEALRLGQSYPFVLHLVLALSALHIGKICARSYEDSINQADHHHAIAVSTMRAHLHQLDTAHLEAFRLASSLICLFDLGKGPRPGHYLLLSDEGESSWRSLLRGVQALREKKHHAEQQNMIPEIYRLLLDAEGRHQPDSDSPLHELRCRLIKENVLDKDVLNEHLHVLDRLSCCFTLISSHLNLQQTHQDWTVVFSWLYRIPHSFDLCLRRKEPFALIIYAYFVVLLKKLDAGTYWFLQGWPEHIMYGIRQCIELRYRSWIDWPITQVELKDGGDHT